MQQTQNPVQAKPVATQVQQKPVAVQTQQKPVAGGQATQPEAAQPVKKKSNWWLWLIVILVSAGAGFAVGYFLV